VKGGAFGFRVSSINKLVDTKSVNNTTLLHFLERTVSKHFPNMEDFLDELSKPAEAHRVNLQDIHKDTADLRSSLKRIQQELGEHFTNMDHADKYGRQMWNFVGKATSQLEDLTDDVNLADSTFTEVIKYFGEEDKNMSSSEFYGIFKTFVTSYKKCKVDNQSAAEEQLAMQKRKQAMEESKITRQKTQEASTDVLPGQEEEDRAALDTLLEKLRNGDTIGRRAGRARRVVENRLPLSSSLNTDGTHAPDINDTADIARDMLARLQSDGFQTLTPASPTTGPKRQTRRRRDGTGLSISGISELDLATPDTESEGTPYIPFDPGSHMTDSEAVMMTLNT